MDDNENLNYTIHTINPITGNVDRLFLSKNL